MIPSTRSFSPFLPLLVAMHAVAQAAVPQPLPPLRVPIHTAEPDLGVPYGIWAAADSVR